MAFDDSPHDPNMRAYPRSPVVIKEARLINGMDVFFGYAQNISRTGLFIGSPKLRPIGEEHEVHFTLPGINEEFKCKTRVVWVRHFKKDSPKPPGIGLEFCELTSEEATLIEKWVAVQNEAPEY
jgi:Tfp pilus assembly protein PilZ